MKTSPRILAAVAALLAAPFVTGAPALAQQIVYDPTNYGQNLLQAARALETVNNQIRSLQNEAQMLLQGSRNLTGLDFSALQQLRTNLAQTKQLIDQAQGLSFEVDSLDDRFRRLYPDLMSGGGTNAELAGQARDRWTASQEALRTTMGVQARVSAAIEADEATLAELAGRSQNAVGLLSAVQATNELLALQAKQMMQGQALQLAQDRASASEAARVLAADERARAVRERFGAPAGTYQPAPVRVFGDRP